MTSGEIFIGDALVNFIAPKDRGIDMGFRTCALCPHMSVREPKVFLFDEPLSVLAAKPAPPVAVLL